ncbi:alpha/beta fold hydrolase [Candidatus Woesearchaeota archaeon]|nr:alpha/beta fold hydrolase [Candidatus Woesearchaeota archaeon]
MIGAYKIITWAVIIVVWVLLISLYTAYMATHPPRQPIDATPKDINLDYESVSFDTEDGVEIKAWFIPAEAKTKLTVIALHGYPFNKANILGFARFLHEDYNLLFFDFRAMGESAGRLTTGGLNEQKDLAAAIKYLKEKKNITKVGTLGFSLGAAVSILSAKDNPEIKAIVSDSGYATLDRIIRSMYRQFFFFKAPFVKGSEFFAKVLFGIDVAKVSPLDEIKQMNVPILFIHGEKDSQIPVENSKLLYEAANQPKELWIIKEADHGESHYLKGKEYERRVLEFFYKHLG